MRDCNVISAALEDESPDSTVRCTYKEVVVVGNGPSAITLSYLLSGRRPYYNRIPHPDPMLSARLVECTQKSLLHQDLPFLSQGLEGRSKNPISLLMDAMTHPGADMGLEWPSLLTWKKTTKSVDHVVIGKEDPGGTWHGIAGHILTISPGRWMALPGLEFKEYHDKRAPASAVAKYYLDYVKKNDLGAYMASRSTVTMIQPLCKSKRRARWKVWVTDAEGSRFSYECRHLVLATGASDKAGCLGVAGEMLPFVCHDLKNFEDRLARLQEEPSPLSAPNATSHRGIGQKEKLQSFPAAPVPVPAADPSDVLLDGEVETSKGFVKIIEVRSLNEDSEDECFNECKKLSRLKTSEEENDIWFAEGTRDGKELDLPLSELKLNGKGMVGGNNTCFVSVQSEKKENQNGEEESKKTVLVVGAGLSASDAILVAWSKNYSVVHAFRSPLTTSHLPAAMYPEYYELYKLMQGSNSRKDYRPLPGYQVIEIHKDNSVLVADSSGNKKTLKVFLIAILIGSQPDLFFLPKRLKNLGIDPNKPVDCKVNPVQIDPFNYRCVRAPPGLYALGPLVGDNFVRFLQGGAIAIAGHILKDNSLYKSL